jgi:hypothetical protein
MTWADLCDDPEHSAEMMADHPSRPTPAEAVNRGVTPSSGGDYGQQQA